MNGKCLVFHWIGQTMRSCDNCGRPTWEHIADHRARLRPFGEGPMPVRLRKRSRIERDRAITRGLADGSLRIRMTPLDERTEFVIEEATSP